MLIFFLAAVYAVLSNGAKVIPKRYVHSANGGKKDMKPHVHHINNGMRELTESQLYHMIITIDDNIHSSGVSLHPTKKRIVYNFRSTFHLKSKQSWIIH